MNYELAKKLKDAGFEQYGNGTLAVCPPGSTEADIAYIPTLEELIEACGDGFDALFGPYSSLNNHEGVRIRDWRCDSTGSSTATGKTAKEAVANLWLALNRTN